MHDVTPLDLIDAVRTGCVDAPIVSQRATTAGLRVTRSASSATSQRRRCAIVKRSANRVASGRSLPSGSSCFRASPIAASTTRSRRAAARPAWRRRSWRCQRAPRAGAAGRRGGCRPGAVARLSGRPLRCAGVRFVPPEDDQPAVASVGPQANSPTWHDGSAGTNVCFARVRVMLTWRASRVRLRGAGRWHWSSAIAYWLIASSAAGRPMRGHARSMPTFSGGFRGRRVDVDSARVPPSHYVTPEFPVLSAGPTPHTPLNESRRGWSSTCPAGSDTSPASTSTCA